MNFASRAPHVTRHTSSSLHNHNKRNRITESLYSKLTNKTTKFTLRTNSMPSEINPNQPPFFCTVASVVAEVAAAGSTETAASASVYRSPSALATIPAKSTEWFMASIGGIWWKLTWSLVVRWGKWRRGSEGSGVPMKDGDEMSVLAMDDEKLLEEIVQKKVELLTTD